MSLVNGGQGGGETVPPSGSGGGSISEITSDDDSVTITDPEGPITDLSVAGGGGGVVSLSGTGLTNSPGDLLQTGGLEVQDASGGSGFTVSTANGVIIEDTNAAGTSIVENGAGPLQLAAQGGGGITLNSTTLVPVTIGVNGTVTNLFVLANDPNGIVTSLQSGDLCIDIGTPAIWQATAAASDSSWVQLGAPTSGAAIFDALIMAKTPRAYWKLNDNYAEATPLDSSGNGLALTMNSTPVMGINPVMGEGALQGGYYGQNVANPTDVVWSIVALFNPSTAAVARTIFSTYDPTSLPYGIRIYQNGDGQPIECIIGTGTTWAEAVTPAPSPSQWHLLVATYDGTNITAYLDGVQEGQTAATYAYALGHYNVGSLTDSSQPWAGALARVAFLPSALNSDEVAALYAATGL